MRGRKRLAAMITRVQAHVAARARTLDLTAEDGLQAAEALMYAFVGVLLLAAVGVALKAAFPRVVNTIINTITGGI
jgi:hypothetical protein